MDLPPRSRLAAWLGETNNDLDSLTLASLEISEKARPESFDKHEHCKAVARLMLRSIVDVYGPIIRHEEMRSALIASLADLLLHYSDAPGVSFPGSRRSDPAD